MTGTAVTSCASAAVVTTTLFKSNIFTGAQYQSTTGTINYAPAITSSSNIVPFAGLVGPNLYVAKATTALTWATIISGGLITGTS